MAFARLLLELFYISLAQALRARSPPSAAKLILQLSPRQCCLPKKHPSLQGERCISGTIFQNYCPRGILFDNLRSD